MQQKDRGLFLFIRAIQKLNRSAQNSQETANLHRKYMHGHAKVHDIESALAELRVARHHENEARSARQQLADFLAGLFFNEKQPPKPKLDE